MFRQFQNLAIECWQHAGASRLGIADRALCLLAEPDAIRELLTAVDEIAGLGPPAKRSVTLKPCGRKKACTRIRLVLSPDSDELREMSATRSGEIAILEFTPAGLQRFSEALETWRGGGEDFMVSPRIETKKGRKAPTKDLQSMEVWFWMKMEP
jgi:hypothetical protein